MKSIKYKKSGFNKIILIGTTILLELLISILIPSFLIRYSTWPIILVMILSCSIIIGYFIMAKVETRHIFISPSSLFSLFYFLLYVIMTFDLLLLRNYDEDLNLLKLLSYALVIAIIGLIAFIMGYIIPLGKSMAKYYPKFSFRWNKSKVTILLLGIMIISGGTLFYAIQINGGLNAYILNLVNKRFMFLNHGYLLIIMNQINVGLLISFIYWMDTKKGKLLLLLLIVTAITINLMLASRVIFLVISISLLYISLIKGKRINPLLIIGLFIGLPIFSVGYGSYIREYLPYGINIISNGSSQTYNGINLNIFWYKFAQLNFDSLSNLITILINVPSNIAFLKGKSFLGLLGYFIPRAIYPSKPYGIGMLFTQTFYPISFKNGSGIAPSLMVDLYWNFDIPGIIIGMILFGIFLRSIYEYAWINPKQPIPIIVSALVMGQIFGWLKSGTDTPTQALIGYIITIIISTLFLKAY